MKTPARFTIAISTLMAGGVLAQDADLERKPTKYPSEVNIDNEASFGLWILNSMSELYHCAQPHLSGEAPRCSRPLTLPMNADGTLRFYKLKGYGNKAWVVSDYGLVYLCVPSATEASAPTCGKGFKLQ